MFVIRKIVVPVATLFLGLSGMFMVTVPAPPAPQSYTTTCEDDWHTPCP